MNQQSNKTFYMVFVDCGDLPVPDWNNIPKVKHVSYELAK